MGAAISRTKKEVVNAGKAIETSEKKLQRTQGDRVKLDKLIRRMDASSFKNLGLSFLWANPAPSSTLYEILSVPELSVYEQTFKQFVYVFRNSLIGQTIIVPSQVLRIIFEMKGLSWSTALQQGLYTVRVMWRENISERCVGMHLSYSGTNVSLWDKNNTTDIVPWEFTPVNDKEDCFIIRCMWRSNSDYRNGWRLSCQKNKLKIFERSEIEWKVTASQEDHGYLMEKVLNEEQNNPSDGMHVGLSGHAVILCKTMSRNNFVWEITPAKMDLNGEYIQY